MRRIFVSGLVFFGATLVSLPAAAVDPAAHQNIVRAAELASAIDQGQATTVLIEFRGNTAELTEASAAQVNELAMLLKRDRLLKVELGIRSGELAKRRVEALKRRLVSMGLPNARIVASGKPGQQTAISAYQVFLAP